MKKAVNLFLIFLFSFSFAEENIKLFDKIVLIVNDRPVLKSEIELSKKWFNINNDKEAVNRLIDQILLYQESKKKGIKVYPNEVKSAILRVAQTNGISDLQKFKQFLKKQDIAYNEFYDLIKREISIQKYIQYILRPKILENSKEAVEETYRKVRIIFLNKNSKTFNKKYEYVKNNLTKTNFIEIARKYSDDPITKESGGLLGNVKKGELLKALDKKIWEIKVGEIGEVNTKKGVYFIYVESENKKFVAKNINSKEIEKKLEEELKLQIKKLREKAVIRYLDKSLRG